jgi:hypothetical protein
MDCCNLDSTFCNVAVFQDIANTNLSATFSEVLDICSCKGVEYSFDINEVQQAAAILCQFLLTQFSCLPVKHRY